jgi:hypothetical protein
VARYQAHDAPSSSRSASQGDAHGGAETARSVSGAGLRSGIDWDAADAFFSTLAPRKRLGWID